MTAPHPPSERDPVPLSHPDPFRLLVESVPDTALVLLDPAGLVASWNPGAERLFGYTAAEIVGSPATRLCGSPVAADKLRHAFQAALEHGRYEDTAERVRKGGGTFWGACTLTALRDGGRAVGFAAVVQDDGWRKRAEAALATSEERYRPLFEANPLPMWVYDLGTLRFLAVNAAAVAKYGWSRDEFLGMTILDIRPAEDAAAVRASVTAAPLGLNESGPWRHRLKGGRVMLVRITSHDLAFDDRPARLVLAHDVTAQVEAERAVRESEERLRATLDAGGMGSWAWDVRANRAVWSRREFDLLGLPPQEDVIDTDLFFRHVHPDDLPALRDTLAGVMGGGGEYRAEFRVVHPDGETRWLAGAGRLYRDPATGRPTHMFGVNFDVTERKRVEDALLASERLYRAVVEHSTDGLVLATRGVGATFSSPAVTAILGYTADEFRDLPPEQLHHPDDLERVWQVIRHAEANPGQAGRLTHRIRHKDGSWRWVESTVTDWSDDPAVGAVIINVRDVSERKQLEDRLHQAAKMEAIGRLAGGVAHDFNNLLTIIGGYTDLVLADLPADDPNRTALSAVRDAGVRAAGLTAQLLAFSRKQVVQPRVLDLNATLTQVERMLRRLIGEDIALTVVPDPTLAPVRIDPTQVEQIVLNLAVNARDAMPDGGRLTLETRNVSLNGGDETAYPDLKAGRYVALHVTDTGHGMTPEVATRVFEPFYTTKTDGRGTGLGLATVYGIARQAGGHVSVYSEVGVGTCFKVLLPAFEGQSTDTPRPPARTVGGTETVLVVEDETAVRAIARLALESHGYRVLAAENGAAALRVAADHPDPIHLLLTDVVMPEMGGRQLVEAVRLARPGTKVLYMSGYTDDAVVRNGILAATDAFIHKPFTPLALAARVRAVLDG